MDRKFTATVVRATGSWYDVLHDGETVRCRIRGRLRLKGVRSTNPVVVGDEVACEADEGGRLCDRRHPAAAQLRDPPGFEPFERVAYHRRQRRPGAADGVAAFARDAHGVRGPVSGDLRGLQVPVTILLSKLDLQDAEAVAEFRAVYEGAGYRVLEVSVREGRGVEEVRELLAGRTTLVSGNSGVGKSTLIQAIDPSLDIRTGEISESHHKGRHTTTFSTCTPWPEAAR